MTRSRLLSLLLVTLSATVPAACGGQKQDAGKVLEQTFGAGSKPIHSGRLDLHVEVDGQGLPGLPAPLGLRLAGPYAGTKPGGVPKFDFTLDVRSGGGTLRLGAISTGTRGWLVFQQQAYTLTRDLFRRLEQSRREALGAGSTGASAGGSSPLRALGIDPRRWLRDPQTVADQTLAGEPVTHVRAGLDVTRLLADVQALLSRAQRTGPQAAATLTPQARKAIQAAVRDARVDVYSGKDDHILRRIGLDVRYVASGHPGHLRFGMGISGINQPQAIGPPAHPRPIGELSASLQQLVGTLQHQQAAGVAGAQGDRYQRCLADAGGDLAKAQACAGLVGQ